VARAHVPWVRVLAVTKLPVPEYEGATSVLVELLAGSVTCRRARKREPTKMTSALRDEACEACWSFASDSIVRIPAPGVGNVGVVYEAPSTITDASSPATHTVAPSTVDRDEPVMMPGGATTTAAPNLASKIAWSPVTMTRSIARDGSPDAAAVGRMNPRDGERYAA
jgi:hypothetical protein